MNSFEPRSFDHLRQVVHPSLAALPSQQLRARIDSELGEGTADFMERDLEGIFGGIGRAFSSAARDVGQFARKAAPAVAHIGGGVLQGAMAGSAAGLPGIIGGAVVGGTGAGLSKFGRGGAANVGRAMTGITSLAGQFSPMGRAGGAIGSALGAFGGAGARGRGPGASAGGAAGMLGGLLSSPQASGALNRVLGGGRAVDQLASLMQRPELRQAMAAIRLGGLGRPDVPVGAGGAPVPVGAFTQLLSHLVGEAAAEMADSAPEAAGEAAEHDFMRGESGEFVADPSHLPARAARLWDMLNEAQIERFAEAVETEAEHYEAELADSDSDYADSDADYADDEFADDEFADDELAEAEAEAEWEAWESEQEFLDSLDMVESETLGESLFEQEVDYAW